MAPYSNYLPPIDPSCCARPARNWDYETLREICEGCPPSLSGRCQPRLPSISPEWCCPENRSTCCEPCMEVPREVCKLPPINNLSDNGRICGNHPRDDCCMVPSCCPEPCPCPVAVCVERTMPIKPKVDYQPPCQPFDGCSIYRTQYRGCPGAPAESYKPKSYFDPADARMDGLTCYREQFTCKPICVERANRAKVDYVPPCAAFEGNSTYRVDYRGCCGTPAMSVKPSSFFDPACAKMDGTTTYRTNYIPYCPAEFEYARGKSVRPPPPPAWSCSPFNGSSTYRTDFLPKCSTRSISMKPRSVVGFSDARFADRTTYRNDFMPFYFRNCCSDPCLPRDC